MTTVACNGYTCDERDQRDQRDGEGGREGRSGEGEWGGDRTERGWVGSGRESERAIVRIIDTERQSGRDREGHTLLLHNNLINQFISVFTVTHVRP